jgi:hypothetical protein
LKRIKIKAKKRSEKNAAHDRQAEYQLAAGRCGN